MFDLQCFDNVKRHKVASQCCRWDEIATTKMPQEGSEELFLICNDCHGNVEMWGLKTTEFSEAYAYIIENQDKFNLPLCLEKITNEEDLEEEFELQSDMDDWARYDFVIYNRKQGTSSMISSE